MADIPSSLKQWLLALPFLGPVLRILAAIKNSNNTLKRTLELEQRFEQLNNNFTERQLDFKLNIARALARKQNIDSTHIALSKQQPLDNDLNDLYIAFENQFRGTADEIKQQQVKYLPFLSAIAQNISEPLKVLDIGCGRGEWLRLLSEHNYESEGVDLSHTMVDLCLLEGFKATQGDAIAYLENKDDNSVHVITAFHVVEHLPFEHMVRLFDQCLRVLKPGGKIIFETPNPENLTVSGYSFYLDPTHKNPIPPITLEFIARQRGYSQIDIYRYNPREEVGDVTPLVENWFNSPVDFAVIAEK
jgi:2-polyprenyl-3-methyl-5-hydroxy-6-metoxy-1,4-benzoquinol methylase|tara:strand:+ start:114 stop:1022 length:909 start_codon:yes stop_codon:yes gene_type:complete